MAGAIDSVGSISGAQCGVSAGVAVDQQGKASVNTASTTQLIHNPQIIQDPTVGFITQYVNTASGQVIDQSPSAMVVAYLRQGLTADGSPKNQPELSSARTV